MEKPPPYNSDFSAPGQGYGAPLQGYAVPGPGYIAPGQGFAAPGQGFAAPGQGYADPGQGFAAPAQGFAPTGQSYTATVASNVLYGSPTSFGTEPVTTVCRNCQANITTSTKAETGTVAWISAGVICALGCWCCFWIPLTMESLKDVTHKCPSCNAVVGRHKGK